MAAGQRVVDVGCRPGALTAEPRPARRCRECRGRRSLRAVPSPPRAPASQVDIRLASAEDLPLPPAPSTRCSLSSSSISWTIRSPGYGDATGDPNKGVLVVACVWDHAGGRGLLSLFWDAARSLDRGTIDESVTLAGARHGHLGDLFEQAGLRDVEAGELIVALEHPMSEECGSLQRGQAAGRRLRPAARASRPRAAPGRRRAAPRGPVHPESVAWSARGIA